MKFKPGPWKCGMESIGYVKTWTIAGVCSMWNTEQAEKNARLVAAAPEMYEAIKMIFDAADEEADSAAMHNACRLLIRLDKELQ